MNVRIFWVRAMKCMYAQTRPRFILSSEGVFGGMEFEPMLTPREKSPLPKMSPEVDRTRDAVDSEPKHYQLSYSGPKSTFGYLTLWPWSLFKATGMQEMKQICASYLPQSLTACGLNLACCWERKRETLTWLTYWHLQTGIFQIWCDDRHH